MSHLKKRQKNICRAQAKANQQSGSMKLFWYIIFMHHLMWGSPRMETPLSTRPLDGLMSVKLMQIQIQPKYKWIGRFQASSAFRGSYVDECLRWHFPWPSSKHKIELLVEKWSHISAGELHKVQANAPCSCFGDRCGPWCTINSINVCVFLIIWQQTWVSLSFPEQLSLIKCIWKKNSSANFVFGWIFVCWL